MAPRPRKHNPRIPRHIDQTKLPTGIYWDPSGNGRWYVFTDVDGKRTTKAVAGAAATLADLHAIIEARTTGAARGTIDHVITRYRASPAWKKLSPRSQRDYAYVLDQASAYRTAKGKLGDLIVDRLSPPIFARLRDKIAERHPAKANTWLRRLRTVFAWGIEDGCCRTNPCAGVSHATEVADHRMPELHTMRAVQQFARERSQRDRSAEGHLAPYLWPFIEIAYQCRLRSIEVLALTDASITPDGLFAKRTKGSLDGITRMNPALATAIASLQERRPALWRVTPIAAAKRPLFVSERGQRLTRDGFSVAWQRMMRAAVDAGVITEAERFTAHGIKHRAITDSDDKNSGGHKSEAMRQRYNHEIAIFDGPNPDRGTSRFRE